jgi:hypothetical protein
MSKEELPRTMAVGYVLGVPRVGVGGGFDDIEFDPRGSRANCFTHASLDFFGPMARSEALRLAGHLSNYSSCLLGFGGLFVNARFHPVSETILIEPRNSKNHQIE